MDSTELGMPNSVSTHFGLRVATTLGIIRTLIFRLAAMAVAKSKASAPPPPHVGRVEMPGSAAGAPVVMIKDVLVARKHLLPEKLLSPFFDNYLMATSRLDTAHPYCILCCKQGTWHHRNSVEHQTKLKEINGMTHAQRKYQTDVYFWIANKALIGDLILEKQRGGMRAASSSTLMPPKCESGQAVRLEEEEGVEGDGTGVASTSRG